MDIYINKRILHIFLVALLFLAASVTLVAAQQQQQLKQSAQTANQTAIQTTPPPGGYPEPPLYGCLQVGEGTNKGCSSKLLNTDLKVTLNGQNAEGKTVFYNQTLNAILTVTNVADLPINIKKLAVAGVPLNANYKVEFTPNKQAFTLNPKQKVTLSGAMHKFNNPDPGGPWKIASQVYTDDGQLVANTSTVGVNVDTTCKAIFSKPLTQAEISRFSQICKADMKTPGCSDFCSAFQSPNLCK